MNGLDQVSIKTFTLLRIVGIDADELGGRRLQIAADEEGTPLIVEGPSSYHEGRVFWPRTAPVIPVTGKDCFGVRRGRGDEPGELLPLRFDTYDEAEAHTKETRAARGWASVQQLTAAA